MNEDERSGRPTIVVGVDDSSGATQALRWATGEARLRGSRLRVVHAWAFGFTGGAGGGYPPGTRGGMFTGDGVLDRRRAADELLDQTIAEVATEAEGVEIERQVIEGGAAEVLVGAASDADLLVVGSRGHGGFAGLLLGSVSQQCAHHASCPVVVVHGAQARVEATSGARAGDSESSWPHSRQDARVEDVVSALREYRTLTRARLAEVTGATHWSDPGFRRALERAVASGAVRRIGDDLYEIAEP